MLKRTPPLVIGIAGGTGSGKTTVANAILDRVGVDHIAVIPHDAYYKDLTALPPVLRTQINFDHPDSLETSLLIEQLRDLRNGLPIDLPVYDFKTHNRTAETVHIEPKPVVMVEGILILMEPVLRELLDIKIFVDTDADIRFIRRLQRDIAERAERATRSSTSTSKPYARCTWNSLNPPNGTQI